MIMFILARIKMACHAVFCLVLVFGVVGLLAYPYSDVDSRPNEVSSDVDSNEYNDTPSETVRYIACCSSTICA